MYVRGEPGTGRRLLANQAAGWAVQSPEIGHGQWNAQPPDVTYGVYKQSFCEPPVQCDTYYNNVQCGYYPPQPQYYRPVQMAPSRPMIPDLPCHQNQQWDYNSMCYNVDGQPCQYTNVVDLEDFM